jgi:shikimate kinase
MSGGNIIFIGYRGTGKSVVAKQLGERLNIAIADSDAEIERQTGKTIADIFAQDSEAVFRDWEERVITEMLNQTEPLILSTGGGAVLRENTRRRLRNAGRVIWLTATAETILQRIQTDANSPALRPNLTNLLPLDEIVSVLQRREPLYQETATNIINTENKSIETIVNEIIELTNE